MNRSSRLPLIQRQTKWKVICSFSKKGRPKMNSFRCSRRSSLEMWNKDLIFSIALSRRHLIRWPSWTQLLSKPIWKPKSKTSSTSSDLKSVRLEHKCKKWFEAASLSNSSIYSLRRISNFSLRELILNLRKKKRFLIWSAAKDAFLTSFVAVSRTKGWSTL